MADSFIPTYEVVCIHVMVNAIDLLFAQMYGTSYLVTIVNAMDGFRMNIIIYFAA